MLLSAFMTPGSSFYQRQDEAGLKEKQDEFEDCAQEHTRVCRRIALLGVARKQVQELRSWSENARRECNA
jgi:hypothetical protein